MQPYAAPAQVQNATSDAVRTLLDRTRPDGLTLLDVRMEPEYEEFHLPGARLLPLPELPDQLATIDRNKPVVVYCRSGKRSAAAASLLAGAGFPQVINLLGGAMAWQGAAATGPPDSGLTLLTGKETPRDMLRAALGMEAALGAFYAAHGASAEEAATRTTFERLAGIEQRHLQHVHGLYRRMTGDETALPTLLAGASSPLEGGRTGEDFLAQLGGEPRSPQEVLELAASVEAQALDLYSRLAGRADDAATASLLNSLAQEEKTHLRAVATLLPQVSSTPNP